ncbi:MAG TPA: response regulator [Candidatus Limnocylindria bacterium]|nr:response regulator [Candidatus Limnocylindria bacterium]
MSDPAPKITSNRVLIADDDPFVRSSLAAVLESEGFVVDQAQNGIEAVTHALAHTPDLALLDLNMPDWDGWRAFCQLDQIRPLLPVIIITARPDQYPKAVELGVDAFMEKPLNLPLLIEAIRQLTDKSRAYLARWAANRVPATQLLSGPEY